MAHVTVTLPDGSQRVFEKGISFRQVVETIGPRLAKATVAVKAGDKLVDLTRSCDSDSSVSFITGDSDEGLEIIRHSTAHVLAMAVQKIWPQTKVTIGPVVKDGFYYDFEFPEGVKLSEKDLPQIEQAMDKIIKENFSVVRLVMSRDEAVETFAKLNESYKVEIIKELPENEDITLYKVGEWFDLCRGPHVPQLNALGVFKLTTVAGAYWRGDSRNTMLTRIYGTAWNKKKELEDYLHRLEEAKKRDHRVIGKQLDLFSFHPEAPAHAFFHEKGTAIYQRLVNYMRQSNQDFGFHEVHTPLIMNVNLWHKSGHYDNYRENMYFTEVDDNMAAVKPMNCPGHCLIYASRKRSYRELPLKLSEFGRVHRHEKSGVVNGLFRVRSFVQDDAHIFCRPDELLPLIQSVLQQIDQVYKGLGFESYKMELSTRPEKSIGSDEVWAKAENALKMALDESGAAYKLNPGDGAFYGPKIDFHLVDAIGRTWQCGTVQLDFSMPARFGLEYVGTENSAEQPVMIHRAVLGSIERFMGIFIEHYAGHFPLWIAPTQAQIINITKTQEDYARQIHKELTERGVRCDLDVRNEKLGYKIREAQLQKVPYMIVIGDKELEEKTISPRYRDGKQLESMSIEAFVSLIQKECGGLWGI